MAIGEIFVSEVDVHRSIGAQLFDVREPDEYNEGHVPGAVLIPLGEVAARVDEFPSNAPFLVICRSGGRSMQAAQFLNQFDRDVLNIVGGTLAWIAAGKPVVSGPDPE